MNVLWEGRTTCAGYQWASCPWLSVDGEGLLHCREGGVGMTPWEGGWGGCLCSTPSGEAREPYVDPNGRDMGPGTLPSGARDMLQSHTTTVWARRWLRYDEVVLPAGRTLTLTVKCLGQLEGTWVLPKRDALGAVLLPM